MMFYYNRAGVVANIALIANVFFIIGTLASLGAALTLPGIAGLVLTIGMSVDANVLIFERIREELRKYKSMNFLDLLNLAVNATLSRTTITSVTTILALLSLYIFGGEVIRGFTFAMIWGVIIGTYSSIFIAAPVLLSLNIKRDWSDS